MGVVVKDKGSSYHCTHCSICTQEQRWKDHRKHEFTNTCGFQAHNTPFSLNHLSKEGMSARCSGGDSEKESLYLFIKQWEDKIYVNTLNDHFNISCQMSIESVIQLLPVDSMLTDVIPCLFIEIIIIAGF